MVDLKLKLNMLLISGKADENNEEENTNCVENLEEIYKSHMMDPEPHVKCVSEDGTKNYNGTNIQRFPVPKHLINWNTPYDNYQPEFYSSNDIGSESEKLEPNQINWDLSRPTFYRMYKIENNYPLNPAGRTGIRGRGELNLWACNRLSYVLITRWKKDLNGEKIYNNETKKPVLQILLFESDKRWYLMHGNYEDRKITFPLLEQYLGSKSLNKIANISDIERERLDKLRKEIFSKPIRIFKNYIDHELNTDNAWFEALVINYHDENGDYFHKFQYFINPDLQWKDINFETFKKKFYSHEVNFFKILTNNRSADF